MSNWNIKTRFWFDFVFDFVFDFDFDFDFGFGFGGETGLDLNLVNSNLPNEFSHVKKTTT